MISDPPAPANAINESPITIVKSDTTAAIVQAATILFSNDPVAEAKSWTWNIETSFQCFGHPSGKSSALATVEDFDGRMACFWARIEEKETAGGARTYWRWEDKDNPIKGIEDGKW